MKYVVTRTSVFGGEDPKVNGVQKELLPYTPNPWYGERIGPDELVEAYTIELDSLEALHQFIKDCGHHIIVSNLHKDGLGFQLPTIEVYDDYRE